MFHGLLAWVLLSPSIAAAATVQVFHALPDSATAKSVQVDAGGNIFVAGFLTPATLQSPNDGRDAFVAKFSADGSTRLYFTVLKGSGDEEAIALVLAPDGSAYVAG